MTQKHYGYKTGRQTPGLDAQHVGEELERIRSAAGELTAGAVVEASRPKNALLHEACDLHKSAKDRAELWSQHKARNIINVITVFPEKPDGEEASRAVPAFVNVVEGPVSDPTSRQYEPMEDILADPQKRADYVQRCLEKLLRVQREFRVLRELEAVWAAIDAAATSLGQ